MNVLLFFLLIPHLPGDTAIPVDAPPVADIPFGGIASSADQEWSLSLPAGQRAHIVVEGAGSSDLDAALLDATGTVVAADEGPGDFCLLTVLPSSAATYTLRVTNRGRRSDVYDIRVETPGGGALARAFAWFRLHARRHRHAEAYRSRLALEAALFLGCGITLRSPGHPLEGLAELLGHPEGPPKQTGKASAAGLEEEAPTCSEVCRIEF